MSDRNLAIIMIVLGILISLTAIPMMKGYKMPGASESYNKAKMGLNIFTGIISVVLGVIILKVDEMKSYVPIVFFAVIVFTFVLDTILKRSLKK